MMKSTMNMIFLLLTSHLQAASAAGVHETYRCQPPKVITAGQFGMGFKDFKNGFLIKIDFEARDSKLTLNHKTFPLKTIYSRTFQNGYFLEFNGTSDYSMQSLSLFFNQPTQDSTLSVYAENVILVDADYYGWTTATGHFECKKIR